jgi:hypothetical protein
MSISQNLPSEGPNLYINFAGSKTLDPRITFSRNSTATYVDEDGIIKTAAVNQPRFDHNPLTGESLGLLEEESKTNLWSYSENPTYSATNAILIPNSLLSPNNIFSAVSFIPSSSTGVHRWLAFNQSNTLSTVQTASFFIKTAYRYLIYSSNANGGQSNVVVNVGIDLSTNTVYQSTSANGTYFSTKIEDYQNGWKRISICYQTDGSLGGKPAGIIVSSTSLSIIGNPGRLIDQATTYTTNGTTCVYIAGHQLESGYYPTSHIPTPATFTSRASSATYYDSTGILRTAATNVARSDAYFPDSNGVFRSGGLLLEPVGTNLALNSEALNSWTNNGSAVSVTANSQIAPDGSITADVLSQTTVTGASRWLSSTTRQYTAGTTYTMSIWLKKISGTDAQPGINFWVEGALTSSVGSITTEWKRYSVTFTPATTVTNFSGLNFGWNDQGVANNFTFSAWGFQIETGSFATSYIKSMPSFTSRASSATYYDVNGILRTAAVNVARSDSYFPDSSGVFRSIGLLYEGASTNLFSNSNPWGGGTNVTWVANQISPTGGTEAYKMVESTANDIHGLAIDSGGYTAGYNQYLTVFAKAAGRRYLNFWAQLGAYPGVDSPECIFDLQNGTVASINTSLSAGIFSSPTIVNVGNGWYRCGVYLNTSSLANRTMYLLMSNSGSQQASSYTGDGSSGILLFGLQKESGSFATSYIPTTSGTVTRSADIVSSSTTTRAADVSSSAAVTRAADSTTLSGTSTIFNSSGGTLLSLRSQDSSVIDSSSLTLNQTSLTNSKALSEVLYYPSVLTSSTLRQMNAYSSFPIVTNGLVLYLDASNWRSYLGTGTTWTDLSGNGNTGTLTNGPTYSSSNGGSIVFDGIDDYATIPDITGITDFSNTNNYTVDFWVYINSTQNDTRNQDNNIVEKWSQVGSYPYTFRYVRSSQTISAAAYNGTSTNTTSVTVSPNNWVHICGVFNWSSSLLTLYMNGGNVTSSTTLNLTGTITNDSALNLMRRGNGFNYATGRLSNLNIYNRALTASEISQNFNALRGRFGI